MIGDHIRTLKAGRWTHAIDCGDETVIVLGDDAAEPPRVRRSYRPDFVAGADSVEVVRHRERTFPAEEVVARAYSRISDPALASMFRDSEAFAEWCTTGRVPTAAQNVALSAPGVAPAPAPRSPQATGAAPAAKASKPAARARPASKAAKPKPRPKGAKATKARPAARAKPRRKAAKARPARKPAKRGASRKTAKRPAARKGARRRR